MKTNWIDVKKEMPSVGERVLIYDGVFTRMCWYDKIPNSTGPGSDGTYHIGFIHPHAETISHWTRVPTPLEAEYMENDMTGEIFKKAVLLVRQGLIFNGQDPTDFVVVPKSASTDGEMYYCNKTFDQVLDEVMLLEDGDLSNYNIYEKILG